MTATRIEDRYIDGSRLRLRQMSRLGQRETERKWTKKYECDDPAARRIVTTYLTEEQFVLLRALPAHALVRCAVTFPAPTNFGPSTYLKAS